MISSRHKLLYIAHQFPPCGGTGVRRAAKVVKYLSRFGWQIYVLTPDHGKKSIYKTYFLDKELEKEIPKDVVVSRSFTPESFWDSRPQIVSPCKDGKNLWARLRFMIRRSIIFLKAIMLIPEGSIIWMPFAVWRGFSLIKHHRIKIIFVTAPHFSVTLTGGILKLLSNASLVTEFRDAWTADPGRPVRLKIHKVIEKWMEAWVIRVSNRVICVTEGVRQDFIRRYSQLSGIEKKIVYISNGYDHEDRSLLSQVKKPGNKFYMVYTGSLSGKRTPKYFLMALANILQSHPELRSRIEVFFVGYLDRFSDGLTIEEYLCEYRLKNVVTLTGQVTRRESLQYQAKADLLLLLTGLIPKNKSDVGGLAGKIFDYMLFDTPVLAIAYHDRTIQIINQSGIGEVINPLDVDEISKAICRGIKGEIDFNPQRDFIQQFDLKNLCNQLSDILSSI